MNTSAAAARMMMMRQSNQVMAAKSSKCQANSSASVSSFGQQLKQYIASDAEKTPETRQPGSQAGSVLSFIQGESSRSALVTLPGANRAAGSIEDDDDSSDSHGSSAPEAADYASFDEFIGAFSGLKNNPVKVEDWVQDKPDHLTEAEFQRRINDMNYRYSLLDRDTLPYGLTRPEEGISRSTDVERTEFIECTGGIERRDYFAAGDNYNLTFIPVMEWRHVTPGGAGDSLVGDVYSMQTPFGFKVTFIRGDGGAPDGYSSGAYDKKVRSMLAEG